MRLFSAAIVLAAALTLCAQPAPDVAAQREAMKKLNFLVGKWSGEATVMGGRGGLIHVRQTEEVQSRLDGLVLLMEGTGRNPDTNAVVFRALATVSYDEAARQYRFRSFNDGRYLDTELTAPENGFEWGYQAGPAAVRFVMRVNEKGEWVETGQVKVGDTPARKTLDLVVRREK
jgi:hypothetical protein